MIVSDEERRNDWLRGKISMPAHERLERDGISFNRYYTHSSPCSPSRASLYTGRYLADHGVVDNVSFPTHAALDPSIPTIGSLVAEAGYRSSYLGKWHLSHSTTPNLAEHGYEDWEGDDKNFVGGPCSGRRFDPFITSYATDWLRQHGTSGDPWFLTVALVNPHDIMWYPVDHLSYQKENPKDAELIQLMMSFTRKGKEEAALEPPPEDYPELFDKLPENFEDDLHTKPEVQRAWREVRNTEHFVGSMSLDDHKSWLRQLDYYAWLHELLDNSLSDILGCLDELGHLRQNRDHLHLRPRRRLRLPRRAAGETAMRLRRGNGRAADCQTGRRSRQLCARRPTNRRPGNSCGSRLPPSAAWQA